MGESDFDWSECLRRVRQQDPEAASRLVEQLYPHVMRIIATRLPRRQSGEDLAQEIFLKMFTNLEQYRGAVPFENWVSRIAVNHCLNALRAERSRPEWRWADLSSEQADALDAALASTSETPDPAHAMAAKELVDRLLDSLDPQDRWIVQLLELEERSLEEVRQLTGWSATRIRVRAFRARRRLNKNFKRLTNQKKL